MIGTVGSEAKLEQARENGCDHVFLSTDPDLARKVQELTGGVDVVYDSIGATTFLTSRDSLRPRGTLVSIGATSGPPPEISVGELARRGSLYLTRPSIAHYTPTPENTNWPRTVFLMHWQRGKSNRLRSPHWTSLRPHKLIVWLKDGVPLD